tara:strand:+ start:3451 stop:5148 length:1698 start_codon:yes stop_codon:yes gene_type:complete
MATFYRNNSNVSEISSEIKVKKYLEIGLSDDWDIYENLHLDKDQDETEIDFLLIHKNLGGVVLETKGGRIETSIDSENKYNWFSIDKENNKHHITDPYWQASNQKHMLNRYIKNVKNMMYKINLISCVAFPDMEKLEINSTNIDDSITFTRPKLKSGLEKRFINNLKNTKKQKHSEGFRNQLKNNILPVIKGKQSLLSSFDLMESEFKEITDKQFETMKGLEGNSKLYVRGSAGTGKTLIAMKFAERIVSNNKIVLFVCFTKKLGEHLKDQLKHLPENRIYVGNIHSVYRNVNKMLDDFKPANNEDKEKYDKYYQDLRKWALKPAEYDFWIQNLHRAFDILDIKIDTVIIDECQDFEYEWQESLSLVNLYNEKGKFYIFGDPKQSPIENWEPAFIEPVVELNKNLRNSTEINQFVNSTFNTDSEDSGISGELEVGLKVLKEASKEEEFKEISSIVSKLLVGLNEKKVPFSEIAILAIDKGQVDLLGNIKALGKDLHDINDLTIDSALRYKGLEKSVVIGVYPDKQFSIEQRRISQLYTGFTRPQKYSYIIIGKENYNLIKKSKLT